MAKKKNRPKVNETIRKGKILLEAMKEFGPSAQVAVNHLQKAIQSKNLKGIEASLEGASKWGVTFDDEENDAEEVAVPEPEQPAPPGPVPVELFAANIDALPKVLKKFMRQVERLASARDDFWLLWNEGRIDVDDMAARINVRSHSMALQDNPFFCIVGVLEKCNQVARGEE